MIKKYAQMNKCMLEYTGKQNLSVDPTPGISRRGSYDLT